MFQTKNLFCSLVQNVCVPFVLFLFLLQISVYNSYPENRFFYFSSRNIIDLWMLDDYNNIFLSYAPVIHS